MGVLVNVYNATSASLSPTHTSFSIPSFLINYFSLSYLYTQGSSRDTFTAHSTVYLSLETPIHHGERSIKGE
jgi:hypothetical protein